MALQSGYIGVPGQSIFKSSSTQEHSLGVKVTAEDGKEYRYIKAGEDIAAGLLVQTTLEHAHHESLTPDASAAGDKTIIMTLGATAATANEYAGGWMVVTNTPGLGIMYEIDRHASNAGSLALTVYLKDPIKVDLTTSSRVDLVHNPYKDCLIFDGGDATETGIPLGVTTTAITSGEYGWICVTGAVSCLADGNLTIGRGIIATNSATINGAVMEMANGLEAQCPVGYCLTTGTDTEYPAVFIKIG